MNTSRVTRSRVGILTASLLASALFLGACHKAPPPPPPPPAEVQVIQVQPADIPIYREWVGTLDGTTNATIQAQVTGYLKKIAYTEGSYVKKDQLLFEIDDRPFIAAVDQAKASLVEAQARLKKTEIDVNRLRPLAASQAVSQQELDNAVQSNAAAQGGVDGAKATLEKAQLELGFTKITAPIDGLIGIAKGQIGDLVGQSSGELTTISAIDPIRVYFSLSEQEYLAAIAIARKNDNDAGTTDQVTAKLHLELELILGDGQIYPQKGAFKFADRQVSVGTGAIRIAGEFSNPGHVLRPGMFSRIRARTQVEKGVIVVPQRAILELQGSHQVLVLGADNKAQVRPVKTGERVASGWIIKDGLKPGETVIVEGVQRARAGGPLHATPFGAKDAKTPPKP
ncbi:efflux RND transporter periplasmic adaptor subunit [Geminisphaera colitermitum]|uniref:efflux RND transporter periplasmic adaptor subunit n=1 Tax=Geminisphaera colitermitum TaxID=1148786 RepID=UPI0001964EEF|nr:efflux RND transporter periplasmic adaptor subunit [Geminisphaera colitermitum]